MFLSVSSSTIEKVEHFSSLIFKVISINIELPLDLKFLTLKGRVDPVGQRLGIRLLLRISWESALGVGGHRGVSLN